MPILCHQQRCSLVSGKTSRIAFQNPSAPSPTASTGAVMPRRLQSRSRSAHDSLDSRNPSDKATSSFVPSARTPIITSRHNFVVDLGQRPGGERVASSFHCSVIRWSWLPTTHGWCPGTAPTPRRSRWWTGHADTAAATPPPCGDFGAQAGKVRRGKPASLPAGLVDALVVDPRPRTVTAPAAVGAACTSGTP
jgi:hypothetical protein